MKQYYYMENDQQLGPFSIEELKSMRLTKSTYVWTDGMTDWVTADSVEDLKILFSFAPPPPPPPRTTSMPPAPVATVTANTTSIMAKNFKCNNCGESLKIPQNPRGVMTCPYCKTDAVLDGLIKNVEIAAKENINSGIPLSATPASLHNVLVTILSGSSTIPLDVFDKIEVIQEEHYCVPAYQFYCNGTVSFSYESARDEFITDGETDERYAGTRKVTAWDVQQGTASGSLVLFAPGNKKLAQQVQRLYMQYNSDKLSKQLVDIEELVYPLDVVTHEYNIPHPLAYSEYVKPNMEKFLEDKAEDSLSDRRIRNVTMGGSGNIQKDILRVFLGLYHVVYKYNDKVYSVWITGEGGKYFYEGIPVDTQRKDSLTNKMQLKEQAIAAIPKPSTILLTIGMWACIILGVVLIGATEGISIILGAVGAIIFGINRSKLKKAFKAQHAETEVKYQKDIDDFNHQQTSIIAQFKSQKKALRGIYEKVSGDESAF